MCSTNFLEVTSYLQIVSFVALRGVEASFAALSVG